MISDSFKKEMSKLALPEVNHKVAIGLSGGSDSLALMLMLQAYRGTGSKLELVAITVNHNLREAAAYEAEKVSQMAEKLGVMHKILTWYHEEVSANIQQQARIARYDLLTDYCKAQGIEHLFVGHNKDDVAETFLMNIFRGSGVYGLASIPNITIYNGVKIIRPLLSFRKQELQNYLRQHKVAWIEDPSNMQDRFLRTKIRKLLRSQEVRAIISDENLVIDRLALNAKNIARARTELENLCALEIKRIVTLHDEGYLTIDCEHFLKLGKEIALKLLSSCLITISGQHVYKPRLSSLENLYDVLNGGGKARTLWGCEVVTLKGLIYVYREIGTQKLSSEKTSENTWIWDNRFKIVANKPSVIKAINFLRYEDLKGQDDKKLKKIPKKIWKSLPLIITYDSKSYIPFLNCGAAGEFSVNFIPRVSLEKTNFFS